MTVWFLEPFNITKFSLLEWITGAIAGGALTAGTYSFVNPRSAARIYGIPTYDLANESFISLVFGARKPLDLPEAKYTPNDATRMLPLHSGRKPDNENLALVHSLGGRNFAVGLTVLVLTMWWRTLKDQDGVVSAFKLEAVQTALGIVILIGVLVPVVDAWVCLQHSRGVLQRRIAFHEREVKDRTGRGGLWEGHEAEFDAYITGKRAGQIHVARSLGWIVGALYCLL